MVKHMAERRKPRAMHYPIPVSSAPRSPAEPPHGGAFCPRGSTDKGQYVPKVRSREGEGGQWEGVASRTASFNDYLIKLFTLDLREQSSYKVALISRLFHGEDRVRR